MSAQNVPSGPHFIEAAFKVRRAGDHARQLSDVIKAYLDTEFCRLQVTSGEDPGVTAITLEMLKPIPALIPLCMGDAVHNLRAALDFTATELVRKAQLLPKHKERVQFPFAGSRVELEKILVKSPIAEAAEKLGRAGLVPLILDEIRPYKGGDDDLWALTKLDNIDKHRLLIATIGVTAITGINAVTETGTVIENCTIAMTGDGRMQGFATDGKFKILSHDRPIFGINIGNGQPLAGRPITAALEMLTNKVNQSIQLITNHIVAG